MKTLILALVALTFVACTTAGQLKSLKPGMTFDQVNDIMGEPDGVLTEGDFVSYQYNNRFIPFAGPNAGDYHATFLDGKLQSYGQTAARIPRNDAVTIFSY